ncbi:tail fiber protein [Ferruginibacter lapsinanis]|uniref:phage tail protein n=1 Tax=Ferruginibacter lapsinanis TaxID=563172 RepID=UPI001E330B7C|nr:tail fiber protein [Ferruginibacter lapsinanis]UEG49650.1 tail fiber protein [Ferruginibacter lapsinanis]
MKNFTLSFFSILCIAVCSAQNVGINQTSPLMPLHVSANDSAVLLLQNKQAFNTNISTSLYFSTGANYTGAIRTIGQNTTDARLGLFTFATGLVSNLKERLSILDNGNVGIGLINPSVKLEVAGTTKTTDLIITGSGLQYDVAKKGAGGNIVFEKGHKGLGLNYIISLYGIFPSSGSGSPSYTQQIVGEVRLFAGTYAPAGWAFCNGQLLSIASNEALFNLVGTTYGGDGISTFALPDLRGAVPVGPGTPSNGASWTQGEISN